MNRERAPLGVQRTIEHRPAGAAVPVAGIRGVAFLAMKVGMNPGCVRRLDILRNRMGAVPIAVRIVPESVQEWRETGGPRSGTLIKIGRRHGNHGGPALSLCQQLR